MTAAIAAAVVFFLLVTLPPAVEHLPSMGNAELEARTIAGAFHIHTTRSDGTADKPTVAAAAARAGLKFAIFTDHGDGTRAPDPPAYIAGVLCLDGVELGTDSGHYIGIDMPASPYALGGAAAAVVEDVARLGGFGIAAHPDSPKPALRWRDSDSPVDALEWLSADSEWRDEGRGRLVRALGDYLVRPGPALASLLDRPGATLSRWDLLTMQRAVVALAGHDAHGGIGGAIEDGEREWVARIPSYEAVFRSMSTRLVVPKPLTGDASTDSRLILDALRRGRAFTAIDAIATPALLDFRLRMHGRELMMGESAVFGGGTIHVLAAVPSGAQTVLLHNGREIAAGANGRLEHPVGAPGVYRVEVRVPRAPGTPPVPWLVSNPIYLREPSRAAVPSAPPALDVVVPLDLTSWRVEHDPASTAALSSAEGALRIDYALQGGERVSQFVALAADLPADTPPFDTLVFTGSASAPMRISVQLRFRGPGDERWVRSVYLSPTPADVHIRFVDMLPTASAGPRRPEPRQAIGILFVVDLTNAAPGTSGSFSIWRPALATLTMPSEPKAR